MGSGTQLRTEIRIGKRGLTDSVIGEIKSRAKKKGIIKIKFLKSFFYSPEISKKDMVRETLKVISEKANVEICETLGSTALLSRKK